MLIPPCSIISSMYGKSRRSRCAFLRQPDHPSKHSITVRSTTASTFPATRRVPLASLISIDPTADGEDAPLARPDLLPEMSDKITGRSLLDGPLPNRLSRYFLRQ